MPLLLYPLIILQERNVKLAQCLNRQYAPITVFTGGFNIERSRKQSTSERGPWNRTYTKILDGQLVKHREATVE
jgi:hypothetical protein